MPKSHSTPRFGFGSHPATLKKTPSVVAEDSEAPEVDDEGPRVWAVMTPEEGGFMVNASSLGVAPNGDRYVYDENGEITGVFPQGFAVWMPQGEEDDDE